MTRTIPVLLYHSISDVRARDEFAVSPDGFKAHIAAVVQSGRVPLTIGQLADGLRGTAALPERAVLITFDDGYTDTVMATSMLADAGLTSTVYIATGTVGVGDGITTAQIAALAADETVQIGAHTVSHPRLDELTVGEVRRELLESKRVLEQMTGAPVDTFAYPHGAYDVRAREEVIAAGFTSAAAVKNALSHPRDDPWAIARWTVTRTTSVGRIVELLGDNAGPLAPTRQRMRTRAYRVIRRAQRRVRSHASGPYPVSHLEGVDPSQLALSPEEAPVAVDAMDADRVKSLSLTRSRSGAPYRRAAIFIKADAVPIGWTILDVPASGVVTEESIEEAIAAQLPARPWPVGSSPLASEPTASDQLVSVVLATTANATAAVECVRSVLAAAKGPHEVIVVENRPDRSPVPDALRAAFGPDQTIRYVEEVHRGLSSARNAGLAVARGEIVAFIDDDVRIDEHWMASIRRAFAVGSRVWCVTGPILPSELETPGQILIEQFATFNKGLAQRTFSHATGENETPLFPYAAGHFGSGANMAFRTERLRAVGGFDPALGTGTAARGGEDLDISVRIIRAGAAIRYEPSAIVWHRHPESLRSVDRQAFHYGVGLGAMLSKHAIRGPGRLQILGLVPEGLRYLLNRRSRKNVRKGPDFPAQLTLRERVGLILGPLAYVRSQLNERPHAAVHPISSALPVRGDTVWSGEVEWSALEVPEDPLLTSRGDPFAHGRFLVRVGGEPVGFVQVPLSSGLATTTEIEERGQQELGLNPFGSNDHLNAAPIPVTGEIVTVVLCTRNRPDAVMRCLTALRALDYEALDVIVVDNAPADDRTRDVVNGFSAADGRIRYVLEPRRGLSKARNRGVAEARGTFIAFTDDDVRVDSRWIGGLLRGFGRRKDVGCVTGLVASSSLEHPAERFFDGRVWWSSSCDHALFDQRTDPHGSRLHPYAAGKFGTGANMAFRTDVLRQIGTFDEALGAGAPTAGGEDLDIFVRLLLAGWALSYEPAALVWHDHRVDFADLETQMYGYGKGLAAYLCKYLLARRSRATVTKRVLIGGAHFLVLGRRSREASDSAGLGPGLQRAELRGMVAGAPAYLRARRGQDPANRAAVRP